MIETVQSPVERFASFGSRTCQRPSRPYCYDRGVDTPRSPTGRIRWVLLGLLLLLGGYLLRCHGCHGDEDNELFSRLWPAPSLAGFPRHRDATTHTSRQLTTHQAPATVK